MADTEFTFSIAGNFPNHVVNPSRLLNEIRASPIVTALDFIQTSGDACNIFFKAPLSGTDQTVLSALVAAHSGAPLTEGAVPVALDTNNQSVLFNQPIIASGSAGPFGNYSSKSVSLIVNVKTPPGGTNPGLQFTISEVDPGDGQTVVGAVVTGAVIVAAGFQIITIPSSVSGSIAVSWTISGTGASFVNVFATLVSKASVGNTDKFGNPIVQIAPQAAAFGLLGGVTPGFVSGYAAAASLGQVAVRATAYTQQSAQAQRSVVSSAAADTGAGTGAQKVTINYLTAAGVPKSETVTLNGTTPVNTVGTDIQYIESMSVPQVGTGGKNAGTISLFTGTGGTGSAFASIAIGDNQTYWAHHYVPPGVTCYVLSVHGSASLQSGFIELAHTGNPTSTNTPTLGGGGRFDHGGGTTPADHVFETPPSVVGPDLILLTTSPNAATANNVARGGFEFIQF